MSSPLEPHGANPHAETMRAAMSLPADNDRELEELLQLRNETDARVLASLLPRILATPQGKAMILAAVPMDEIVRTAQEAADKAARRAIRTEPVPEHEHRAHDVIITTYVRGLSRIGAALGALLGGLLAWWLVAHYSVTTIQFGKPGEMHSVNLAWIHTAIAAVCVLFFALIGALVGPRRKHEEQLTQANITLARTHMHQGRVPAYDAIAKTARHTPKDDK